MEQTRVEEGVHGAGNTQSTKDEQAIDPANWRISPDEAEKRVREALARIETTQKKPVTAVQRLLEGVDRAVAVIDGLATPANAAF